ncbi:MAG: spore maturation protein [Tenericutes bacterium]|nr:spore maturation protein [Mycoplasmatota bacterium]MDD7630480.1 nucleoside recognition domain-containing protein [bacterium]MDY4108739.1 nucleoside recognition domain-containing protein [Bacilli bacterium]
MINKIWFLFISIGIVFGIINNKIDLINTQIIKSAKDSLDIFLNIFPTLVLWVGVMNIVSESGLLIKISNFMYPLFKHIFPDIKKGDEALSYISSALTANFLGMSNAATPFSIKAMKSLQEINTNKECASRSMITFLLINSTGFVLVPTTVISLRMMYKSINPTKIILPTLLITFLSTIIAIILDKMINKVKNE